MTNKETLKYWQEDSAAAWDRCEEYRLAIVRAIELLDYSLGPTRDVKTPKLKEAKTLLQQVLDK